MAAYLSCELIKMGEHDAMCEKVLRTLENIIETNSGIQEFAIVQTTENQKNKSPVLFEENCLGLESWCKSYIRNYSHSLLLKNRRKLSRKLLSIDDMKNLNHIVIGAVLLEPNVVTFWNMKRDLVENEVLSIEQELYFDELVLSMHSKSYEAFSYRKWLLNLSIKKFNDLRFFNNENVICEKTAQRYPNNYHSWNYRIWCMEKLWQLQPEMQNLIFSELKFSRDWITSHISEYTGYYYRQFLLDNLWKLKSTSFNIVGSLNFESSIKYLNLPFYNEDSFQMLNFLFGKSPSYPDNDDYPKYINMLSMLLSDLLLISVELNYLYNTHESLWNYRRFLIIKLIELVSHYHNINWNYDLHIKNENISPHNAVNMLNLEMTVLCSGKSELPKKVKSSNFYNILMKKEIEFIEANKNTENTTLNLPMRHLMWLNLTNFYK